MRLAELTAKGEGVTRDVARATELYGRACGAGLEYACERASELRARDASSPEAAEALDWIEGDGPTVLHFVRPGGWQCVTNFGTTAVPLPRGALLLASGPLEDDRLPPDTTAWLR